MSFDANNSAQTTRLRWRYRGDEYAWIEREHSSGAMTFGVDGTERMRIENGNVGIGTTSPQARLHIEGGSSEILLRRGDGSLAAYLSGNPAWNGGTARMILYQAGGDDGVYLNSEGSSYFRGGRVGIGTRDPEQPLDVRGNAVISGNLGIGTSDPTAKLDVAGTVKATAFQGEGMVPAGSIMAFGGPSPPPGWFLCDGTPVSRTTYANLWAAIGAAWGVGNGATTFNLPELRGYFLRGRDGGVTRDPERGARTANSSGGNTGDNVGSVQADEFKSHNHPGLSLPGGGAGWQSAGAGLNRNTTGVSGGSETRPKNAYVNYIIKY